MKRHELAKLLWCQHTVAIVVDDEELLAEDVDFGLAWDRAFLRWRWWFVLLLVLLA